MHLSSQVLPAIPPAKIGLGFLGPPARSRVPISGFQLAKAETGHRCVEDRLRLQPATPALLGGGGRMHRTRFQKRKERIDRKPRWIFFFLFSSLEVSMLDRSKPAQRSLARLTANISEHRGKVIQKL
jgi:hypothetical protein